MTIFEALGLLFVAAAIYSFLRARRIALTSVGCDPTWLPRQWVHRRYVRNEIAERRANYRRMS